MAQGWDGNIPVCEAQQCPIINVDEKVHVNGNIEEATFGNVVRFSCKSSSQMLFGSAEMYCDENGEWVGKSPTCKACSNVKVPNGFGVPYMDTLYYTCEEGYKLPTKGWWAEAKCNDMVSSELKPCIVKPCELPDDTPNGFYQIIHGEELVFGTQIKYFCNEGYQMVSKDDTRTCFLDNWTNHLPICDPLSCDLPPADGGFIVKGIPENDDPILPDRFLEFSCDGPWKYLNGSSMLICLKDGQWDNAFPTCEEKCKVTGVSDNVRLDTDSEKLRFSCHENGDTLLGNAEVTCLANGQWSAPFPTCGAPSDCGKPTPLEDGDIEGTVGHRYRHGDRVKYTCPNYYKMQGDPHKTCTNGEWIGQMRCLTPSDCGKPTPLEDGDIEGTVGHRYRHGDRVKYTCPNYYKMQGDPHKTCTNGEWIGQMRCLTPSDCGKPTPLEDGDIEGTVGHRYRHGDRVKYTCPNYYKMQGDPHKTCTNGEWIGQMRCLTQQCPIINVDEQIHVNGNIEEATFGNVVRFSCKSSSKVLLGSAEMYCDENGEWVGKSPTCKGIAPCENRKHKVSHVEK
ncbi:hypothetical protein KUCAC02_022323 [Chaenocephalus aceratus]|uniref:Uncharacterized protein n=1 Tax=Chaenocephalus aceratus TaxID=36190 RepID=A0ACB9XNQ2_CHAAC|nr:hypothetical protein KUCAC02_022323 [Chaenocephalus aceratus]